VREASVAFCSVCLCIAVLSFSHGPSVGAETKIVKRPHREQEEWDFLLLLRDHHHIKGAGEQSGKTLPTPLSVSHSNFRQSLQRPVPLQNISQRKNASDKTFTDVFPQKQQQEEAADGVGWVPGK